MERGVAQAGDGGPDCPRAPAADPLDTAAILVRRHGFGSAGRDADWLKQTPILFIELGAIEFMKLNFPMTKKLSVWPNKDERSSEPAPKAIWSANPTHGLLIASGDGVICRVGI